MVRGTGLAFNQLIAPFRLNGDVLELTDARAFNSSLGMTAKGTLDMARERADLQGTCRPIFSIPCSAAFRWWGGCLARSAAVGCSRRRMRSVAVSLALAYPLNPLAAVTPGFLRGLFDIPN
jgi:hypothetical protein